MTILRLCWDQTRPRAEKFKFSWPHIQGPYLIQHLQLQHDCDFYTSQLYLHLCLSVLDLLECVKMTILHLDCHFWRDKVAESGPGGEQRLCLCSQKKRLLFQRVLRRHEAESDVFASLMCTVKSWDAQSKRSKQSKNSSHNGKYLDNLRRWSWKRDQI